MGKGHYPGGSTLIRDWKGLSDNKKLSIKKLKRTPSMLAQLEKRSPGKPAKKLLSALDYLDERFPLKDK